MFEFPFNFWVNVIEFSVIKTIYRYSRNIKTLKIYTKSIPDSKFQTWLKPLNNFNTYNIQTI